MPTLAKGLSSLFVTLYDFASLEIRFSQSWKSWPVIELDIRIAGLSSIADNFACRKPQVKKVESRRRGDGRLEGEGRYLARVLALVDIYP